MTKFVIKMFITLQVRQCTKYGCMVLLKQKKGFSRLYRMLFFPDQNYKVSNENTIKTRN